MQILHENLDKGYVICKVDTKEKLETLDVLANVLVEKGFVKESFVDAVKEREKVFPTGLPMEAFGVAIPHTDSVHVNKKAILCAVLENDNEFICMGTDDETVSCKMAFMLAIISPEDQIAMLGKLMETCQNVDTLNTIYELKDMDKIVSVMEGLMA